jgi:probable F420-dependent oxidoreductase
MAMRFWQCISYSHPREFTAIARTAEAAGFDGLTLAEHIFYPLQLQSQHPYSLPDTPAYEHTEMWGELWTSFAAMAAVTEHLRFASAVHVLPMHDPFYVAKALANLAHLSDNRVVLGCGAGWMAQEFDAFGVDFATRGRRYDESIALLRALWRDGPSDFAGEFFQCQQIQMLPAPTAPIPILIGGKTEIALRRAARLGDGWLATGESLQESLALIARVQELRKEYQRDHLPFTVMTIQFWGSYTEDDMERMRRAGVTDIVNWTFPFAMGRQAPPLEQKQEYLLATGAAIRQRFG